MKIAPGINKIVIDGDGDLTFTRHGKPFYLDMSQESNIKANVQNFHFVQLNKRTRIGRFIQAMKFLWTYCK